MERQGSGVPALKGLHVLVIDDSPDVRDVFATLLRLDGADAVEVASGHDALSVCRTHDFDVVVTDLGLPDVPGDALIRALVALARHPLHVIVVTGERGAALSRAREAGAGAIFTKPCDWTDIVTYVNELGLAPAA